MRLFDMHTHLDFPAFEIDRIAVAQSAYVQGVHALLISGVVAHDFMRLVETQRELALHEHTPKTYIVAGLHPAFISQHRLSGGIDDDVAGLDAFLHSYDCVAVGEIGLDTFTAELKQPDVFFAQCALFEDQLAIAKAHNLPAILHIRKAHADALKILKNTHFHQGGIAHSFSGGVQEAKAFVDLGFKLGVTGQVCNPNAKKLRQVVQTIGAEHLVIETDCPDMLPYALHTKEGVNRNEPANLVYVLDALSELLVMDKQELAEVLWDTSCDILRI